MQQTKGESPAIHPTAVVHPDAVIGEGTTIGPYSIIGAAVELGPDNDVQSHVTIQGRCTVGARNRFYPYACVGLDPQDKKYGGEPESRLSIGDDNIVREFVTINRGSKDGGGLTQVGHRNWIMAYCHIAHDCTVGDDTVFANCATLAGHCHIEDKVYLGGFTAVHQFCSIGRMTMTGGQSMITQDVPPYMVAVGNRARLYGVNKIGMERGGIAKADIQNLQAAYKIFFRSNLSAKDALARLEAEFTESETVRNFITFVQNSTRGILR